MIRLASTSALLLFTTAWSALGAIDGTVINGTTRKPQPEVSITLVKPGQGGMQTLGTATTDAAGHFLFENDKPGGGPQLLQASYKGINYNKLMTPNIPTSNVEVEVFEATQSPAVAKVSEHILFLEPSANQLAVSETVIIQNDSETTYKNDSLGSLRFYLPPAAKGQVRVNAQGPQGMPLPQTGEKTEQKDILKVTFPIKPGKTEFEVVYVLPPGSPAAFQGRVTPVKGMPTGPLRLVIPPGVTLTGNDMQKVGTEPKTQATIYNVTATGAFTAELSGTGSLHSAESETDASAVDTSDSPQVTQGQPPIYRHLPWLVALTFSILAIGLVVLFRSSPVRSPYGN